MKRGLLIVAILIMLAQASFAQGFILSGKITGKNNKPAKNALIQAVGNDKMGFATTNADGLYYTAEIPAGNYEVIVKIDSIPYITKLTISPTDPKKRFYNFKVKGKTLELTTSDKDVFMETALSKAKTDPVRADKIKDRRR